MSSTVSETSTATTTLNSTSTDATTLSAPANLKPIGIILAVVSGVLIGSSFVFKKKGLIKSQAGGPAGEGVGYLKSVLWWTGMIMMILGEVCNFAAYAFVEALVVTPLGALSVVVCAILSSIFLKESLSFFGWLGCGLCILGSVIIALNGPHESAVGDIREFQKLFLAPGFLAFSSVLILVSLVIIFYFAPKYGKKSMLWYIFVCSMIGGISVSVTTGLGASIVSTFMGRNQFNHWFIYFLIVFVIVTLVTEVYYLNVALALFNTAMVTPTYYVIFTFFSMVTTVVLFQGLKASVTQIITIVMAFLVICCGITILQLSKVDPTELKTLDRRSTLLLAAAKKETEKMEEKDLVGVEEPGIDSVRGSFGGFGSMVRARTMRRMSMESRTTRSGVRTAPATPLHSYAYGRDMERDTAYDGLTRHTLYDAPVPSFSFTTATTVDGASVRASSSILHSPSTRTMSTVTAATASGSAVPRTPRTPTIKFREEDVVHKYSPAASGWGAEARHERREAAAASANNTRGVEGFPLIQTDSRVPMLPPLIDTGEDMEGPGGLRTAPAPTSTSLFGRVDPFEDLPATAAPVGYGSSSRFGIGSASTTAVSGGDDSEYGLSPAQAKTRNRDRVKSHFSEYSDDEEQERRAAWRSQSQPHSQPQSRSQSRSRAEKKKQASSSSRSPGRSRHGRYPRTGGDDDREESMSLVRSPEDEKEGGRSSKDGSASGSRSGSADGSGDEEEVMEAPIGGIRLVGSGRNVSGGLSGPGRF